MTIQQFSARGESRGTIISVHVPKAAGTSLFRAFQTAFGEGQVQRIDDDPLDPTSRCSIDPVGYIDDATHEELPRSTRVVHGHFWVKRFAHLEDAVRVTVLRDPVERLLSHYFFWKHSSRRGHVLLDYVRGNDLSIEEFARLPMIARLYSDVFFKDTDMASFDFIGDAASLRSDLARLSAVVGVELDIPVSNTNPEPGYREEIDAIRDNYRLLQRIRDALKHDIAFYEAALGRTTTVASSSPPVAGGSQYADPGKIERQVDAGAHRSVVGGMWDEIGALTEQFLIDDGLEQRHRFLDVGCGSLRIGVKLVPYLERGNYFGIDINPSLLDAGFDREIVPLGLADRLPRANLVASSGFEVPFEGTFDVVLALSVFTHLPFNDLRVFLEQMVDVTTRGSKVYVTYFPASPSGVLSDPVDHEPGGVRTYGDRNPFHLRRLELDAATEGLPFELHDIGEWNHPRGQFIARYLRM